MRVLALETSERIGSVALLEGQADSLSTIESTLLPKNQRSTQSLLPCLQAKLSEHDWPANQLDLICVSTGPGSFTGLRIGITVAKTLAYATGAKLIGIPTLSAIAAGVESQPKRLWTILDAQRQELFVSCFVDAASHNSPDVSILSIESWLKQLQPGDAVAGPPLKKLAEQLPEGVIAADQKQWAPSAEQVGRLAAKKFLAQEFDDPIQLVPNYYRRSAAEEKADQVQT